MRFLLSILSRRCLSRQRVQEDWISRLPGSDYYIRYPADVDRAIGAMSEIGMGGPNVWVQYLRDGAILGSVHTLPADVDGGRLRVALTMSAREGKRLLAYDPARRCIDVLPRDAGRSDFLLTSIMSLDVIDRDSLSARRVEGLELRSRERGP